MSVLRASPAAALLAPAVPRRARARSRLRRPLLVDPLAQDVASALDGPRAAHWFGTDELGRDILARVVFGARTSLLTAAGAVAIAGAVGIPVGLVAGFFGGWRDTLLMRAVDVLLALPGILFAMALIAVLGRSEAAALVAVGITGIPSFARVARAETLSLAPPRFRARRRGVRRLVGLRDVPHRAAECVEPDPRAGRRARLGRDPARGRARLSRRRHPAADAELGRDAAHRQDLSLRGADLRRAARPRADAHHPLARHARPRAARPSCRTRGTLDLALEARRP